MPQFSKWHRLVGRVVVDRTHGFGAWLGLVRLRPAPARAAALEAWLGGTALARIAATPAIVGACAVAADPQIDAILARALGQQPESGQPPEWGVLVEGVSAEAVRACVESGFTDDLAGYAAEGGAVTFETCRFLFGNQRLDDDARA